MKINIRYITIYVVKFNDNGTLRDCNPCLHCLKYIKQNNIYKLFFIMNTDIEDFIKVSAPNHKINALSINKKKDLSLAVEKLLLNHELSSEQKNKVDTFLYHFIFNYLILYLFLYF